MKPVFIAVEGIDGVGKSTQIPRIAQWFHAHGMKTSTSCEPTHNPIGMKIRSATTRLAPDVERQYFIDDRKEHLESTIRPALARGEVTLTDRYFYSSIAYQGTRRDAFDHAPSRDELEALQDEIYAQNRTFAPEADILIYLQLDVDIALERMRTSRDELDPFENRKNLVEVAHAYDRIVQKHPCVVLADASQSIDDVTRDILDQLERILL